MVSLLQINLSNERTGIIGVAGHVGCGHCHSHKQFIQDDSVGLATVLTLFQEATHLSLKIKDVRSVTGSHNYVEVETESGGIGRATARRGITIHEAELVKTLVGKQAINTHTLVLETFGRIYGQGIHEVPVAVQTAIANAALDSFVKNYPDHFISGYEDLIGSCGRIAGAVLDINGIPVSVIGTVNASIGGIGPNEDMEGNIAVGVKKEIMEKLGMIRLPTIVVEGKVYWPAMSDRLDCPTFLVRQASGIDNCVVADCIYRAAQTSLLPIEINETSLQREVGALTNHTIAFSEKVIALAEQLKTAEFSQNKVNILAELSVLVSQDGGGISFMSDKLYDIVGGIGMLPATSAVFSYIVPRSYYDKYIVPFATEEDVNHFVKIVKKSVQELYQVLPHALTQVNQSVDKGTLESLVLLKG